MEMLRYPLLYRNFAIYSSEKEGNLICVYLSSSVEAIRVSARRKRMVEVGLYSPYLIMR